MNLCKNLLVDAIKRNRFLDATFANHDLRQELLDWVETISWEGATEVTYRHEKAVGIIAISRQEGAPDVLVLKHEKDVITKMVRPHTVLSEQHIPEALKQAFASLEQPASVDHILQHYASN